VNARSLEKISPAAGRFARAAARTVRTLGGYREAHEVIAGTRAVTEATPRVYFALLRQLARGSTTVLDVGTGLMDSLTLVPCRVKVGVDAHRPYLEHRRVRDAVPVHANALEIGSIFVPGAVDLVTMFDVLEHFERADGLELLRQAERVAARRVVLITPRGSFPQEGYDAFGLGGEDYQQHRSAWEVADLTACGYRVVVVKGFHDARNESFVRAFGAGARPVDALVAWKDVTRRRA